MRFVKPLAIIGVIVAGVVGVLVWHLWFPTTTTLSAQSYRFSTSPQGLFTVTNVSYVLDGQHEIVVKMASVGATVRMALITSDARNWTTTSTVTVTQTAAWFEIPGWNCGYSNDNGRLETTQIATSAGNVLDLSYSCIYPPTASSVGFTSLVTAPWSDGQGTTVP